jgi:hypothetical protein
MRRPIAALLLGLAASVPATELDLSVPRDAARPSAQRCDSVVQRSCRPADAAEAATATAALRELEQRRAAPDLDRQLEAVVIEGERQRRPPSLRELLESRAPPPPGISYQQWRRDDGSQCACSSPCRVPPPFSCCVCSQGGSSSGVRGTVN